MSVLLPETERSRTMSKSIQLTSGNQNVIALTQMVEELQQELINYIIESKENQHYW